MKDDKNEVDKETKSEYKKSFDKVSTPIKIVSDKQEK